VGQNAASKSAVVINTVAVGLAQDNEKIGKFETMDFNNYIEISADKRFGRPCVKGTRVSVYDVLNWLANGMSKEAIIQDFPELNEDMINACLAFAAEREHRLRVAS